MPPPGFKHPAFRLVVAAVFSQMISERAQAQCNKDLLGCKCAPQGPFVPFDGVCAKLHDTYCKVRGTDFFFCDNSNAPQNRNVCGTSPGGDCTCWNGNCRAFGSIRTCDNPNPPVPSPAPPTPAYCTTPAPTPAPTTGDDDSLTGDPHMAGLRGQHTEWSGVDGGWYSLIKDEDSQLHINVRLNAPLAAEFPNRQLVTGVAVLSDGHSLVIEVKDPYSVATGGCHDGTTPCLADGALRVTSAGSEDSYLLHPMDGAVINSEALVVSAANLPAECSKFGGDKIWAETFAHIQAGDRRLLADQSFEDWVVSSRSLAAPEWCAEYVSEHGLAQVQSKFATFRIQTASVTVRLNVGVNYQGSGETDWDGRVLPDLEFWQMDVGLANLHIGETLTGILGETSRPVLDEWGAEIMEGPRVIRGAVEDYRLSGPLDQSFDMIASPQSIAGEGW